MNKSIINQETSPKFSLHRRDFSILVAQSDLFNCEILSQLLKEQGYNVVGRAVELEDTLRQIKMKRPKCVILESEIEGQQSFNIVQHMKETDYQTKFILYTRNPNLQLVSSAMQTGFLGFLYSTDGLEELYRCFNAVSSGDCYYSDGFTKLLRNFGVEVISETTRDELSRLTKRERQVLQMIADGHTTTDIADQLNISYRTAVNHKANMVQKLNLDSCRQLPRYSIAAKSYL